MVEKLPLYQRERVIFQIEACRNLEKWVRVLSKWKVESGKLFLIERLKAFVMLMPNNVRGKHLHNVAYMQYFEDTSASPQHDGKVLQSFN